MLKFLKRSLSVAAAVLFVTTAHAGDYGLGRPATEAEIKLWDIDIRPDGQGLPEGSGSVSKGDEVFQEQCAMCHGTFAEGEGRWPVLAGGQGSLASEDPVKTIGSYWPYLSTVYDYIYRAMPFGNAQSLSPDDTYALVAYLLYMNEVVDDEEFVLSKDNFTSVRLPNEKGFFIDAALPDVKTLKDGEPCMKMCKPNVEVVMRARVLDVTPRQEN